MGYLLALECPDCQYKSQLQLGQGIRDCKIENVCLNFPEEVRGEIRNIIANDAVCSTWNYERKLGICNRCQDLREIPEIDVSLKNSNQTMKITGRCKCGESAKVLGGISQLEKGKIELKCPHCNKKMVWNICGFWD